MSGGHFDYSQYRINDIIDSIECTIEKATGPRPPLIKKKHVSTWELTETGRRCLYHWANRFEDLHDAEYYFTHHVNYSLISKTDKQLVAVHLPTGNEYTVSEWEEEEYEDGKYYPDYTKETLEELQNAIKVLRRAYIYAHRIDYFICGDDGEEAFHRKLKEELNKLTQQENDKSGQNI